MLGRTLLVAWVLAAPVASAAMGPEQGILDAYLQPYDRVPDLPYCGRISPGGREPSSLPPLPVQYVNGTNALMDEHMAWHTYHTDLRQGAAPHDDNNTYGVDFVMMHRMAIAQYDAWRVKHGHAPVVAWDPSTPIPAAFAYAPPDGCQKRRSEDPAVPLPKWLTVEGGGEASPIFHYASLCDFPTLNRLGKELDEGDEDLESDPVRALTSDGTTNYHTTVHSRIGGDMAPPHTSMRDPVFWAWHKWLDSRAALWETACAHHAPADPSLYMDGMGDGAMAPPASQTGEAPGAVLDPRATPVGGLPLVVAAAGLVVLVRRLPKR